MKNALKKKKMFFLVNSTNVVNSTNRHWLVLQTESFMGQNPPPQVVEFEVELKIRTSGTRVEALSQLCFCVVKSCKGDFELEDYNEINEVTDPMRRGLCFLKSASVISSRIITLKF